MKELANVEIEDWDSDTKLLIVTAEVQMYAGDRGTEVSASAKLTKPEMIALIEMLQNTLNEY